jgi:hypothetical protein
VPLALVPRIDSRLVLKEEEEEGFGFDVLFVVSAIEVSTQGMRWGACRPRSRSRRSTERRPSHWRATCDD